MSDLDFNFGLPRLLRIPQFPEYCPAWTEKALRSIYFYSQERTDSKGNALPVNGYATAFVRQGGKLLVDTVEFFRILREQNETGQVQPTQQDCQANE